MFMRLFALVFFLTPGWVAAQECDDLTHKVQSGETIFSIAERYYGSPERWSLIFYGNQRILSGSVFEVTAGTDLKIPCLPGQIVADSRPLEKDDAEMRLVTGSNYAPFTDRNWPGEGMITELVNAAMEATTDPVTYSITWEDDWSKHLFPMLDSKEFDMGFPWYRPNCEEDRTNERCANFHFSDPIVELLGLLFVKDGSDFTFEKDSDAHGRTLCRPAGYFTFDIDRADRRWLTEGLVNIEQPATPTDCFQMLMDGTVDAVALNEFTGWTTINDMGLRGQVKPLPNPLSIQGLHVIISKRHWRGTSHLYRFNAGLRSLKDSDRYDTIVSRHLGEFWKQTN